MELGTLQTDAYLWGVVLGYFVGVVQGYYSGRYAELKDMFKKL